MNIQESKAIILKLCEYEKKITIRNLIVYFLLFVGIVILIYLYALPQLSSYFNNAYNEVTKSPALEYLKFVIPLALFLTIWQPAKLVYDVLKRKNKVEEVFTALDNSATIQIFDEETKYLTIIPLIWVKLNLNPITHLHIAINNKSYQFPIDENYAIDCLVSEYENMMEWNNTIKPTSLIKGSRASEIDNKPKPSSNYN